MYSEFLEPPGFSKIGIGTYRTSCIVPNKELTIETGTSVVDSLPVMNTVETVSLNEGETKHVTIQVKSST